MQTQVNQQIPEEKLRINDVITLTARLAQVLAEEVDLLKEMKVGKIESLQREKLVLIGALDAQRKLVKRKPELLDTIPSQERADLEEVVTVFNEILAENHRKLTLAKEVNHKIVQAITHVVKEQTMSRVYDDKGLTGMAAYQTLSVTLDKVI